MPRALAAGLTAGAVVWALVIVAVPAALSSHRPAVAVAVAITYDIAGRICHQRPERSFRTAGVQQPVCGRCLGLYASGALGALLGWTAWRSRAQGPRERWVLLACAVPTALTWGLEVAGLAAFSSASRALAAVPLGAAAGWIFVRALRSSAIS